MKKILSVALCLFILGTSFCLTACFGTRDVYVPPRNVTFNLPDKVHVEYNNGKIYAKDGKFVYAYGGNFYGRGEVLLKEDLTSPAVVVDNIYTQNYMSAYYSSYANDWIMADNDEQYDPYHANDNNHISVYGFVNYRHGPEYYLRTGYTDVNGMVYETTTLSHEEDEVLTIGGNQVECDVWQRIDDYGDTYGKYKYWYAKNTGICIKSACVFNANADINAEDAIELLATYYSLNETINDVLQARDRLPIPAGFANYN